MKILGRVALALVIILMAYAGWQTLHAFFGKESSLELDATGRIVEFRWRNYDDPELAQLISSLSGIRIELSNLETTKTSMIAKDVSWDGLLWAVFGRRATIEKISERHYRIVGKPADSKNKAESK